MTFDIRDESPADPFVLAAYAAIPIAFTVTSRFSVRPIDGGLGGLRLVEETIANFYVKNYDAIDGESPMHWSAAFDLARWGILSAFEGEERVGGAVVAWNTPGVDMLEDREDLAVLWDLRVRPDYRGRGAGHALFAAAEAWARSRGCRALKVETQDINVPACRFYARQGCELRTIRQDAYPGLPDEAQLLWYKTLQASVRSPQVYFGLWATLPSIAGN